MPSPPDPFPDGDASAPTDEMPPSPPEDELKQTQERLLRTAAELQNVRRRAAAERDRTASATRREVLVPVLEVYDDVLRALASARAQDVAAACAPVLQGVEIIAESFGKALGRLGVERMDVVGQPFDTHLHEAVLRQPARTRPRPATSWPRSSRGTA